VAFYGPKPGELEDFLGPPQDGVRDALRHTLRTMPACG
jgi:hypothetical protein